jgi:hypothetical protein
MPKEKKNGEKKNGGRAYNSRALVMDDIKRVV